MSYSGQPLKRLEDPRLVAGKGSFVDDIHLPNMLYASVLRSFHAHALIRSIDVSAARSLPGVVAVLTELTQVTVSVAASVVPPMLLFENNRVKAWNLTLEPGQSTPQHTHELDEIVICLESSKLRILKPGPEPEGETIQPGVGDVFMPPVKGVTHVLTNVGDTRYRQISIELK